MSVFTQLGSGLWSWEPFRQLCHSHDDVVGRCTKLFWITLYTAPEAKLVVPGLWHGSITSMSEAAGVPTSDAIQYLDRLLEHEMVEFDQERRVLRLTQLPDCGESPSNGNAIRGWWRRFQAVPQCTVRDAHVTVLHWMLQEWSRVNGKPISEHHTTAWSETFGRMPMPAARKRGVRRLLDSDTSTVVQPSLFGTHPPVASSVASAAPIGPGTVPQAMGDAGSVDKLARSADLNKINNSGTNDDWFGNQRDQDQDPDQDQVSDLGSGEGGSGGGHDTGKSSSSRPTLVLVPRPAGPTTVPELVALLAVGRVYDAAQHEVALAAALDRCGKSGVTAADVDLLRDAFRHGWSPPVDRADPVAWWSFGDRLYRAFLAARARKADLDQKRQWAREAGLSP